MYVAHLLGMISETFIQPVPCPVALHAAKGSNTIYTEIMPLTGLAAAQLGATGNPHATQDLTLALSLLMLWLCNALYADSSAFNYNIEAAGRAF